MCFAFETVLTLLHYADRWRASNAGNILDRFTISDESGFRSWGWSYLPSSAAGETTGVNVVHFLRSFTSLSRQPYLHLLLIAFAGLVLYRAGAATSALDGYGVARFRAFKYEPLYDGTDAGPAACEVVGFRLTRNGYGLRDSPRCHHARATSPDSIASAQYPVHIPGPAVFVRLERGTRMEQSAAFAWKTVARA
jgi:hypothetical protein